MEPRIWFNPAVRSRDILSGFIFEIGAMPEAIQLITHIVLARYFVAILQTLFLAGDIWPIVLAN